MDFFDKKNEFINSLELSEQIKFELRNKRFTPFFKQVLEQISKPKIKYKYDTRIVYKDKPCLCERTMRQVQSVAKVCLKTGEVIEKFASINDGAKSVNGSHAAIIGVLKGTGKSAYGYFWKKIGRIKVCPSCLELKPIREYREEQVNGKPKIGGYCFPCEAKKNKFHETKRTLMGSGLPKKEAEKLALKCIDLLPNIRNREFSPFVREVAKNGIDKALKEYKK
jgi:hypothetical protein